MNATEINGYNRPIWQIMAIMSNTPLSSLYYLTYTNNSSTNNSNRAHDLVDASVCRQEPHHNAFHEEPLFKSGDEHCIGVQSRKFFGVYMSALLVFLEARRWPDSATRESVNAGV